MRKGRLSHAEKMKPPSEEHQREAELFMEICSNEYEELKNGCKANQLKKGKKWDEDVFQNTFLLCYETIQRNGIRDKSIQGCKNYFFNSFKMNILHDLKTPYNSRCSDDECAIMNYDEADTESKEKINEQVFNDWCIIEILKKAEENSDLLDYYCFRLKYLLPKMSYRKLVALTKIKNAKKRVKNVMDFLKENITKEGLIKEFENNFEY